MNINCDVFSPLPLLLFCWVFVLKCEMSAVLIHSLSSVFLSPHTTLWLGAAVGTNLIIWGWYYNTRRMSVKLSIMVQVSPSVPWYQAPAVSADTDTVAHNALVTCHIIWVVSSSQSEASMGLTDQSEAYIIGVCPWLRPCTHCCLVTWGRMWRFPHSEVEILTFFSSRQWAKRYSKTSNSINAKKKYH